jgi:hypothetical protein
MASGLARPISERRMVDNAELECNSIFNAQSPLLNGPGGPETADKS